MTHGELIKYGQNILKEAGIEDYENDTRILAMYAFDMNYTGLMMKMLDEADEASEARYKEFIGIRAARIPCQHITGTQEFMGYEFDVSPDVLIPRQETELLVEEGLAYMKPFKSCKALDVCCGSGCIGISFSLYRQKAGYDDKVTLLDISKEAVEMSKRNITKHNANCHVILSDLFENINEKYDIIMSNPPYIRTADVEALMDEVKLHEPRLALDGYEDGLYFYDKIIKEAREYLSDEGKLLFEIGYDQFQDVRRLLVDAGYSDITLKKDYAGLDRVVGATWKNS